MQTGNSRQERYTEDKPEDCAYCYFWKNTKKRCGLAQCHYLIGSGTQAEKTHSGGMMDCAGCPYGRHSRCIGYCLQKIMQETALKHRKGRTGA